MGRKKCFQQSQFNTINDLLTNFMRRWLKGRDIPVAVSHEDPNYTERVDSAEFWIDFSFLPSINFRLILYSYKVKQKRTVTKYCNYYTEFPYTSILSSGITLVAMTILNPSVCKFLPSRHFIYNFNYQVDHIDINIVAPILTDCDEFVRYLQQIDPKETYVDLEIGYYDTRKFNLRMRLYDEFIEFMRDFSIVQTMASEE